MICKRCLNTIEIPLNLIAEGRRADREYFGVQRRLSSATRQTPKESINPPNTFDCANCEKSFSKRKFLKQHIRVHIKVKCSICNIMIPKLAEKAHFRTHLRDDRKYFGVQRGLPHHMTRQAPSNCKRPTTSGAQAARAMDRIEPPKAKASQTFASSRSMGPHQMHRHRRNPEPSNTFDCEKCEKSFSNWKFLKKHRQIHFRIECSICNKTISKFSEKAHFRTHLRDDRKYFGVQSGLPETQQATPNELAKAPDEVEPPPEADPPEAEVKPPEEFLLILPSPTGDQSAAQQEEEQDEDENWAANHHDIEEEV